MLDIKRKAPAFHLKDETGTVRRLSDYSGSWVIIYFYPKDDTPGCTKEACSIATSYDEFTTNDIIVLGISADSVASHAKFRTKYNLPFTLLSDADKETLHMYNASESGSKRKTYIIDKKGFLLQIYEKVSPATHADQLQKDLRERGLM